ncbi:MAG: class I SAM-dependent methyltransferase [Hyphomicrobiales bacterium]|nr:class I SAM-dependent methyltransferase [Rhodoblastus sp.]MCC2101015.1 class I SAM-dependent methyltransferase [Hyphomicrobiales bacterium]MCO5087289.1 class I SAM-dependent methyltransferase [Methylobacteriaceae bacterium]HRY03714.1 class I SAM-dependent methyltransferase [Beijerinckiaceae bacterium]MCC2104489.1 class I SAM-dependent methyltransferase [Hyphomicrobiales bacterium]
MNIPTRVLPKDILDSLKRARPIYALGRRMRFALGTRLGARKVPGLSGRAHYNDFMLSSADAAHVGSYRRGAQQTVDLLGRSLVEAGRDWDSVEACLEVGCGYGRIVRELRDRLDASRIHVTDVIAEGARFTASEFGATAIPVIERSAETMPGKFDLIYLLSVYTHLRRDLVARNLAAVTRALKSGGVLVFTTHGQGSAETAERYEQYWLDKNAVLEGMAREGYYYERYPYYYDEYGLTWFRRDAMCAYVAEVAPELEFVAHHPMGAEGHQDVFVYRKR